MQVCPLVLGPFQSRSIQNFLEVYQFTLHINLHSHELTRCKSLLSGMGNFTMQCKPVFVAASQRKGAEVQEQLATALRMLDVPFKQQVRPKLIDVCSLLNCSTAQQPCTLCPSQCLQLSFSLPPQRHHTLAALYHKHRASWMQKVG